MNNFRLVIDVEMRSIHNESEGSIQRIFIDEIALDELPERIREALARWRESSERDV